MFLVPGTLGTISVMVLHFIRIAFPLPASKSLSNVINIFNPMVGAALIGPKMVEFPSNAQWLIKNIEQPTPQAKKSLHIPYEDPQDP